MKKRAKKLKHYSYRYPWLSALCAPFVSSYFYIATQPHIIDFYQIPSHYFQQLLPESILGVFFVILLFDARVFHRRSRKYEQAVTLLNKRIDDLLMAKQTLQRKARTFAGHADKLKLFISDRLLEYIEYDEKFLHFKSIASEVRHNGVISFDKVQTALKHAIKNTSPNHSSQYHDALSSMIYLWDLLELSTTDNLALHISNQLCECEEHYYQTLLEDDVLSNGLSSPTFSAGSALTYTLNTLLDQPITTDLGHYFSNSHEQALIIHDSKFYISIENTKLLLGNVNHIILLLENLINNAVFYANKKTYLNKHARLAVQLSSYKGYIRFSIYNHGPHISDADKDQIFQLGYSTRKVREHNGKGLGLYFVNEIVKGYEGKISFNNISNYDAIYVIQIIFSDKSVVTESVEVNASSTRLECKRATDEAATHAVEWASKQRVLSIEVSLQTTQETFSFTQFDHKNSYIFDPSDASKPRWVIEVAQLKRSNKVIFIPLDVTGVCFSIDLPCAESRLDYTDDDNNYDDFDDEDLSTLRENFLAPDSFSRQ